MAGVRVDSTGIRSEDPPDTLNSSSYAEAAKQAWLVMLAISQDPDLATRKAATALGIVDDVGSIEVGKLADIVLLNRDPLADIDNTRSIWRVIKGGWVFDPQMLRTR